MARVRCHALAFTVALSACSLTIGLSGLSATSASTPAGTVRAGVRIDPLRVSLDLGTSRTQVGTKVAATVAVRNVGKQAVQVSVRIEPLSQLTRIPSTSQLLGRIAPGGTRSARWALCASAAGTYRIVADARGNDSSGHTYVAYSAPVRLVVSPGTRPC